ncbi:MAG: hypothetical protein AB1651_16540 [Pseudomonadota bacterium]
MADDKEARRRKILASLPNKHTAYFEALYQLYQELNGEAPKSEPWQWPVAPTTSPHNIAFRAAMYAIEYRIVCPVWVSDAVIARWEAFRTFELGSLGDAFGIKPHKHSKARRKELNPWEADCVVSVFEDRLAAQRKNVVAKKRRAIADTAEDLRRSVDWVRLKIREAKKRSDQLAETESGLLVGSTAKKSRK